MKAITYTFNGKNHNFKMMAEVFTKSWFKNAAIPLHVYTGNPPETGNRSAAFYYNHHTLEFWIKEFKQAKKDMIFMDCDMLCLGDITSGFDYINNVGVCKANDYPFNAGVMFVKYNKKSLELLERWQSVCHVMLHDVYLHDTYKRKYAGINQASLGYLMEIGYDVDLLPETYNLCQPWNDWQTAKLIHIKSDLRQTIFFGSQSKNENVNELSKLWWSYAN